MNEEQPEEIKEEDFTEPTNEEGLKSIGMRVRNRSRGRMDIRLRFNKDQTDAIQRFMAFVQTSSDNAINFDDFFKLCFFKGLDTVQAELKNIAEEYAQDKLKHQKEEALKEQSEETKEN